MSLIQKIKDDQLMARKARNSIATDLLTTLLGEASIVGKNAGRETTDAEVVAVIQKFVKGVDETTKHVKEQGDQTIADKLALERIILTSYLPQQLNFDELRQVVMTLSNNSRNKGEIMKLLKQHYSGQYDGKMASSLIDTILA